MARSNHLAQIGFDFATLAAETLLALARVVGQTRARLRAQAAVGAGFSLAGAGASAVLDIGRIDDGIHQIQFHALHFELRQASVKGAGDVDTGAETDVLAIPSADKETGVEVESARGAGRLSAHLRPVVDEQNTVAEAAICRYLNPLAGSYFAIAPQNGWTRSGIESELDPLVFDGQRRKIALSLFSLSAIGQQRILDLPRLDPHRHPHPAFFHAKRNHEEEERTRKIIGK